MSTQLLLKLIDEGYKKQTWHGPNLRGAIRGLSAKQAAWRPGPHRHNIWEVVVHTAYWKYIVRRRITGGKRGAPARRGGFPLKGSNWFHLPVETTDKAWRNHVQMLDTIHREMRDAIANLRDSDLKKHPTGSNYTIESTVYGIAFHDVYHAGQIQLLKRLYKRKHR
jgi:uncharacterized damage-inducible protein DinB